MDNIKVTAEALSRDKLPQLEHDWKRLFANSGQRFFLSWNWIGSWIATLPSLHNATVLKVFNNSKVIGLAIFYKKECKRHGFVTSTQWHLHRTGEESLDQIWIEYNGFLSLAPFKQEVESALVKFLLNKLNNDIDEVFLHLTETQFLFKNSITISTLQSTEKGFFIDLMKSERTVSKSTHKQITKSIRLLKHHGNLSLIRHQEPKIIGCLLDKYGKWHQDKWQDTTTPSGLSNPKFTTFHQILAKKNNLQSPFKVILYELRLDETTVALQVCFEDDHHCYFYLASLKPFSDNKIKTGLVLHSLVIDDLIERGFVSYDFLAGYASYKQKLSTNTYKLFNTCFQKHKLSFKVETMLKDIKQMLLRIMRDE